MLEIPINALLICYGPLAITIIGFILFAALTDVDARRSYLRRLDLRKEDEAPEVLDPIIKRQITTETPSGVRVTIGPPGQPLRLPKSDVPRLMAARGESAAKVAEAEAPVKKAPAAPPPAPPAAGKEDNLKRIEGIGPKVEGALKDSGVTTFAQIAAMGPEELVRIVKDEHGVRIVGDAATWPKQAQFLVDGDEEGLQAYQDRLVSGREPDDE